jgi:hypothetical protein
MIGRLGGDQSSKKAAWLENFIKEEGLWGPAPRATQQKAKQEGIEYRGRSGRSK